MRCSPTADSLLSAVAIAPDGTWIATADEAGTVRTWDAAGTPAQSSSATNQRWHSRLGRSAPSGPCPSNGGAGSEQAAALRFLSLSKS